MFSEIPLGGIRYPIRSRLIPVVDGRPRKVRQVQSGGLNYSYLLYNVRKSVDLLFRYITVSLYKSWVF